MSPDAIIRAYDPARDQPWAESILAREFAGRLQARRGELVDALEGEGVVAASPEGRLGLLTWLLDRKAAEAELRILIVEEAARGGGVGTAMLERAVRSLAAAGCRRVWVVTTNDAIDALAFYQRQGFRLAALRRGAVDEARSTIKPSIGVTGNHGIPIRDEIELTLDLAADL